MPILRDLFTKETRGRKNLPSLTGTATTSSVNVTPEKALQVAAVFSSIRVLAESVAATPTGLFKKTPGYRTRSPDHKLARLLTEYPNSQIDSGEYWRTVMGWSLLRGNGYTFVERNGAGDPMGLWPISPSSVKIKRSGAALVYELTPDEDSEYVPVKQGYKAQQQEMLHYRAFGLGVEGLSPIALARQQIGLNFATSSYVGGFFARDASPGGIVSVDGSLTDEQYTRLEQQWKSLHEGFDNSHKLAVMEGGAKWETTTLSPADAEFLEIYKLTRQDIAGIYGVPPHMIGDLDKATFSNIEQQSLNFVIHSLVPWLTRLEKVTNRLFDTTADAGTYIKFNTNGLLRGDSEARAKFYAQGRQWGWLSANDILRREDEDPIEGGDVYLTPLNMSTGAEKEGLAEARAIAEIIQKIYLGVGKVISEAEARKILHDGGVDLDVLAPAGPPLMKEEQ